ncbi:MAG: hypothetical protein KH420_06045 [Clostridiales bacterium]|nr:hypothetical protein [Clostridiales bacterium]
MEETQIKQKPILRGELALLVVITINSLGVVLMLHSGSGISTISSVPYVISEVLPFLSLGTWTYLFQGLLILSLMILRRRFVFSYLLCFVVGFFFGLLVDAHELWVLPLPQTIPLRIVYFVVGYAIIAVGIALSNRCKMPIIPTDLFPRELADITKIPYARIKITFDLSCLAFTALLGLVFLHHLAGLGIGTVLAALTTGKVVGWINQWMDRHWDFTSFLELKKEAVD